MPRTRPPYPVEFRRETVELVRQGRSIGDVAKSLGVSHQTLHNWCKQTEVDQGHREGLTSDEKEELTQLRRRVWFASESMTQIRVLITRHLRGFRHDTEGVFDDRAGTFGRQRWGRPSAQAVSLAFAEV
jgi:transposase